jgi:hypothetical protein
LEAVMPFDGAESPYRHLEKFDQVIDLVEDPKKWVKHTYVNRGGQYCLIGALNAVGVEKIFGPIILKTIDEMTDREFCCIESFNDHPETLHRDVVAMLYRTRERIAAGKFKRPAVTYPLRREGPGSPSRGGWSSALWRKVFGLRKRMPPNMEEDQGVEPAASCAAGLHAPDPSPSDVLMMAA